MTVFSLRAESDESFDASGFTYDIPDHDDDMCSGAHAWWLRVIVSFSLASHSTPCGSKDRPDMFHHVFSAKIVITN